jgi:hypothetical protein
MTDFTISSSLNVSFLLKYAAPHVYVWRRGDDYLYIGSSIRVLSRLAGHDIVGVKEPLREDDALELYACSDTKQMHALELRLIRLHKPKYNIAGKVWGYNTRHRMSKKRDLRPDDM